MMSAKGAMISAIEWAERGEIERARLWVDIARELRQGERLSASIKGVPTRLDPEAEIELQDPGCAPGEPVPTRPVIGVAPDGTLAYGRRFNTGGVIMVPAEEPPYRRAETEVIRRIPDESTPAYEAAGDSLGDTRSIPARIAHPQAEDRGGVSTCLSPECGLRVIWIVGRGWVHDTPSHPASCTMAARDVAE